MFIRCSARVVVSGLIHSRSFVLYLAYILLCLGLALAFTQHKQNSGHGVMAYAG